MISLLRRRTRQANRTSSRRPQRRRMMLEHLQRRDLLAGDAGLEWNQAEVPIIKINRPAVIAASSNLASLSLLLDNTQSEVPDSMPTPSDDEAKERVNDYRTTAVGEIQVAIEQGDTWTNRVTTKHGSTVVLSTPMPETESRTDVSQEVAEELASQKELQEIADEDDGQHAPINDPQSTDKPNAAGSTKGGNASDKRTAKTPDPDGGYTETRINQQGKVTAKTKYNKSKTKVETTAYDSEKQTETKTTFHTGELKGELIELGELHVGKPKQRTTTKTTEDGQVTKQEDFSYSEDGHVVEETVTDEFGRQTRKQYQYMDGKLVNIWLPEKGVKFIYVWDANGNLESAVKHKDNTEVGRVEFDKNGKLIKKKGDTGGISNDKVKHGADAGEKKADSDAPGDSKKVFKQIEVSDVHPDSDQISSEDANKADNHQTGLSSNKPTSQTQQTLPKLKPVVRSIDAGQFSDRMLEIEIESGPRLVKHFLDKAKEVRDQADRHRQQAKQRRADAKRARTSAKASEQRAKNAKTKDSRDFHHDQAKTYRETADLLDKSANDLDRFCEHKDAVAESYEQDAANSAQNYAEAMIEQIRRQTNAAIREARAKAAQDAEAKRVEAEAKRVEAERQERLRKMILQSRLISQDNAGEQSKPKSGPRPTYRRDGRIPRPGQEPYTETLRKALNGK